MSTPTRSLRIAASLAATLTCGSAMASLCGTVDTRTPFRDMAIGRLVYDGSDDDVCTAWIASNGAMITAGHCMRESALFVEFDVPPSNCNGTIVNAPVSYQFNVDQGSVEYQDSTYYQGAHGDWAVFQVSPNVEGKYPVEIWGEFYRPTQFHYADGTMLRITGYGIVRTSGCDSLSRTEQTATGPLVQYDPDFNDEIVDYQVDAVANNSGSPVMVNTFNLDTAWVIGIHTGGTCGLKHIPGNSGNTFVNSSFASALNNLGGKSYVYVDWLTPPGSPQSDGTIFRPYPYVSDGLLRAKGGDTVSIVTGYYPDTFAFTPPGNVVINAPVGNVVIDATRSVEEARRLNEQPREP